MKRLYTFYLFLLVPVFIIAQEYEEIKVSELPKTIPAYVSEVMPGGVISRAAKATENGQLYYAAVIDFRGNKRIMIFDKDGNFVKRVEKLNQQAKPVSQPGTGSPSGTPANATANSTKIIPAGSLPATVQSYLRQNHPNGNISEAKQLIINRIPFYQVTVSETTRDLVLTFNKDGKYLSKRTYYKQTTPAPKPSTDPPATNTKEPTSRPPANQPASDEDPGKK
jgi:hypothetical protein